MCMIFCYLRFCVLKSIMGEGTIYHKVFSVGGGRSKSERKQNSCKIDYFNKIIIKSLCIWIFFCIFARNCVNGESRRDHRLLMGKQDKGFKQIGI